MLSLHTGPTLLRFKVIHVYLNTMCQAAIHCEFRIVDCMLFTIHIILGLNITKIIYPYMNVSIKVKLYFVD